MAPKRGTRAESRGIRKTAGKQGAAVKVRGTGPTNRPSTATPSRRSKTRSASPSLTPSDGARSFALAGSRTRRPVAAASPVPAAPTWLERAEGLWAQIVRSKLTHPDPWDYTAKARVWAHRAEQIVEDLAMGRNIEGARRALTDLTAELEQDRDFDAARKAF